MAGGAGEVLLVSLRYPLPLLRTMVSKYCALYIIHSDLERNNGEGVQL
jgi:hypothetical protein